jgi:mono/diheme cytochrome c family protein
MTRGVRAPLASTTTAVAASLACLICTGCAVRGPVELASSALEPASMSVELPPGAGRAILQRQCLNCHELDALELFSGFYGRDRWRSLVITMRDNGAVVDDGEVEVLAAYLARHFGTGAD